jgi:tetratricopeptide (TPR) repeat protein
MAEISLHRYSKQIESTIKEGRYAEAVAHGQRILKRYPRHIATYRLLGRAMLETDQDEYAADMFRRVLSADCEDLVAWVGMSEVYNRRGELDTATWCLERAFEVASDREMAVVEEELRHLYGRRDGVEPERVQLTRGALARLYLKGDLLPRAISEFRALLAEHPERVDLRVALAEALWRNDQRLEAADVCQQVLDVMPDCLKANLILGEIWISSGREEGQVYLRRAEALDPENQVAQELFGAASPLPPREVSIGALKYRPPAEEVRPAWMAGIEAVSAEGLPAAEREAALFDVTGAVEAQIEIPPWLEEVGGEEEEVVGEEALAAAPPAPAEPLEERPLEEAAPALEEEVPEWLAGIREELAEEGIPERPAGLGLEPTGEEEYVERLAELGVEPAGVEEAPPAPTEEEALEWLAELGAEPPGAEEAPPIPGEEEIPAWLAELRAEPAGVEEAPPAPAEEEALERLAEPGVEAAGEEAAWPAELPEDWLAGIREELAEEAEAPEEAPAPAAEEAPVPAWLEGEGMPSGDEALAWLEQLTAGKEEELQAQAEAEAEARMAEIMGRAGPTEAPAEEAAPEEAVAPPAEEPVAPPVEAPFGWTAFGEPEAPPEAVAPVEEAPPVAEAAPPEALEWAEPEEAEAPAPAAEEVPAPAWLEEEAPAPAAEEAPVPAWLEGEGMPSGDEALAWLEQLAAGKEEELQAQAEAEVEARMAEIMGRAGPAEAPAAEEAVAPPAEEPVAPPVEAPFGWTAFGEPEAPPEAVAPVEEAPPVEEAAPPAIPEPAYAEEVEAPPVAEIPAAEEAPPPEGIPAPEVAPPIEEVRWGAAWEVPPEEAAPAPVVEEVPGVVEMEAPVPAEEVVAPPEVPTVEVPAEPLAAQRAHLKEHPRDYEAWLALARALWQAGERPEALEAYTRVIRAGKLLEDVTADLEEYVEQWPDAGTQRALGDAYMKGGRLREALGIYRRALETL